MIEITAIHLQGGDGHEQISAVQWRCAATSVGQASREAIVQWLGESAQNVAVVADGHGTAQVVVVHRPAGSPYLRARLDGVWTDHLLSLPRF